MQQTSAVRSSIASAKRSTGIDAVRLGTDVHDLGAAQLLRVGDLADGRELVLADHDPGAAAALERQRRDDPADALRDGRRHGDLVGLAVEQLGEARARRLGPLDPEFPLGPVLVPAGEVLLVGGADAVRERALRARVEVRRVLEDRELAPTASPTPPPAIGCGRSPELTPARTRTTPRRPASGTRPTGCRPA